MKNRDINAANNAAHDTDTFYICNYCKPHIFNDVVPARCVLNGLKTVPLPKELENLDPLSIQLIQRAKCYQTVIRLGAYTAKVPVYNSLKVVSSEFFFHKPITVHIELYLFYCFIHFLLYIGQY